MAKQTKALKATAYHEAGHAVAALRLNVSVRSVSIVPTKGSLGRMAHYRKTGFSPDIDITSLRAKGVLERDAIVTLAGPAAEKRYTGRYNGHGAGSDIDRVLNLLSYACPDEKVLRAYFHYLRESAAAMMRSEHVWAQVAAVARELLKQETIGRAAFLDVANSAVVQHHRKRRGAP